MTRRLMPVWLWLALAAPAVSQTDMMKLPPLKAQPSPQAVVNEHLDALNRCDWQRLMAQYPANVEIFLPGGDVIRGRVEVGKLFQMLVKPFNQGGLCGLTFTTDHSFTVGTTVNAQWHVTGEALAAPYRGADAYVTRNGLMWAQVTTFQRDQLKTR